MTRFLSILLVLAALAACASPYVSARHEEGAKLLTDRRYDEAVAALQAAAAEADQSASPKDRAEVRGLLGWAYAEARRFEEAERETQAAIRLAEAAGADTALLQARLAVIKSKSGDYDGGLAAAARALALTVERWRGRAGTGVEEAVLDYAVKYHGWPPDVPMIRTVTMAESAAAVLYVLKGDDRKAAAYGERAMRHFDSLTLLVALAPAGDRYEFYRGAAVAAAAAARAYRNLGDAEAERRCIEVGRKAFAAIGLTVTGDDLLAAYAASVGAPARPSPARGFTPDPHASEAFNHAERLAFDGAYAAAVPAYREAIAAAKASGNRLEAARGLSQLGWLLAEIGRYGEAIRLLREAAALVPNDDLTPVTYARLSAVEGRLGLYQRGLEDADRAMATLVARRPALFKEGRDREAVLDEAMKNPGLPPDVILIKAVTASESARTTISYMRDDWRGAIRQGEIARRHFRDVLPALVLAPEREQISYHEGLAFVTLMLGDARLRLGEVAAGRALLEESRPAFARARLAFGDLIAEGLIAWSSILEGDYAKGTAMYKANLARVEAGGYEELKWHMRAELAADLLREARALEAALPALAAIADQAQGEAAKREMLARHREKSEALASLVAPERRAALAELLAGLERAAGRDTMLPPARGLVRFMKEEAYGNLLGAADSVESIRANLETDLNKRVFLANKQRLYRNLILLAVELHGAEAGFEALERAKARGLMDLLATKEVAFKRADLAKQEEELKASVGVLLAEGARAERDPLRRGEPAGTAVEAAVARYRDLVVKLQREEPELASLKTAAPLKYRDLAAVLPPDVTLLEYFPADDRLLVWAISAAAIRVTEVPVGEAQLTEKVRAFRSAITGRDRAATDRLGRELYDLLIQPVRAQVAGARLGIVPHGSLHYLPFQALRSGGGWLIEERPLFSAPSAAVLRYALAKRRPKGGRLLAFGNPDVGDPAADLPYAQREVESLARLYPGALVHVRAAASERAAKEESGRYDLLHFASHAEFSSLDPLYSGLRLAADGPEDGRLDAAEVFGLDLRPYLVTLSACQTGLGAAAAGDEMIGLPRAFIYAGAPSIVASLWSVSDPSTAALMERFYSRLRTEPKDVALQQAQVELLKTPEHAEPLFWAAFYLTGDWR